MITAKYPVTDTEDFLTLTILSPESDPESTKGDKRSQWFMKTKDFEKSGYSYGVDELQCTQLAYLSLAFAIMEWEKSTGKFCEYYFMPRFELHNWVQNREELYKNEYK